MDIAVIYGRPEFINEITELIDVFKRVDVNDKSGSKKGNSLLNKCCQSDEKFVYYKEMSCENYQCLESICNLEKLGRCDKLNPRVTNEDGCDAMDLAKRMGKFGHLNKLKQYL